MPSPSRTVDARTNHLQLVADFVQLALRDAPASVYDVGCGSGNVLRAFAEHGVRVRGLDQAGPEIDELRASGFEVDVGSAYDLPVPDDSFEWVAMRHVPHHLEDPARAVAEAWRVASRGVRIAEPYFETALPEGRAALELDRWEKRLHRREGRYHAEVHDVDDLLATLPREARAGATVSLQRTHRLTRRSVDDFEREARALTAELPSDDPAVVELDDLLAMLRTTGLAWNGSLCVTVRRD